MSGVVMGTTGLCGSLFQEALLLPIRLLWGQSACSVAITFLARPLAEVDPLGLIGKLTCCSLTRHSCRLNR